MSVRRHLGNLRDGDLWSLLRDFHGRDSIYEVDIELVNNITEIEHSTCSYLEQN